MDTIIIAIISLSAIGLACAALITVASKVMFVEVDVRVEMLRKCLPGANCGACGFSSCDAYAEALVNGDVATNLCLPAGEEGFENLNSILGVSGGAGLAKMTAVVQCLGDSSAMIDKMEYDGIKTCFAVKQLFGGEGACTYGCLGYGDCVKVCPSDAICVEDNLARINPRKCTGCAVCVKVCPVNIILIQAEPLSVAVMCRNTEKGAILKSKCSKGCIGCMKCVKVCTTGAITVNESLASIDYNLCNGCRECVDVCISRCIV